MVNVEEIKQNVKTLSPEEMALFRQWFLEYDAAQWDAQIENDVQSGLLDDVIAEAVEDLKTGQCFER